MVEFTPINMRISYFLVFLALSAGCVNDSITQYSESADIMGTIITITVMASDEAQADKAISDAFETIRKVDSLMSTYKNTSQISMLNNEGVLYGANPELVYNIKKSIYYSRLTDGAFDITVQPILNLYKQTFNVEKRPPTSEEIMQALELVGYDNILIEDNTIRFARQDMQITLGAIAKGYAVDQAVEALEKAGIEHALVNAGGDMRALGSKTDKEDWQIALQDPRDESNYVTVINIGGKSVATSGDYELYFINKSVHHIIDPKTGHSATGLISVTVIAEEALDADAFATSVFVLGPQEGLDLVERSDNIEALLITESKRVIRSTGFSRFEREEDR